MTIRTAASDADAATLARFAPLRPAERLLLHALRFGDIAKVSMRRPTSAFADVTVRAALLAQLLRGPAVLPARRLELMGAWIEGRLDLGDAEIGGSLWFYRCTFDAPVLLEQSHVAGSLTFAGCRLVALHGDGCTTDRDFALSAGCRVERDLRLARARIGGHLDCSRLRIGADGERGARCCLAADAAWVGGELRLAEGFAAQGEVRFVGARIEGDAHVGGHFTGHLLEGGGRGPALTMDRANIGGSLHLDGGYGAAGCTSLRRTRIGGDLDASGASFDRLGDTSWDAEPALVLDRATVDGTLALRRLQAPLVGASFVGARVSTLADDEGTWGERLALDGFDYSRFGDGAPLDTRFRTGWLERQEPAHLRSQFRVQPWRRLIRVLRRMGHEHRAASVAMQRERWLRRIGVVGEWAPPALRWLPQLGHRLLGVFAGYGYRPGRLLVWVAAIWLACGLAFWLTSSANDPVQALGFSLARLLPVVDLELAAPGTAGPLAADLARWIGQAEAGFGWAAALLLLASLAGWADRDRR